jgi:hypothetical protein
MGVERGLLEQEWLDHLQDELEKRVRFREELLGKWQRRREQCADDNAKAMANGDLTAYRTAPRRWRKYYATVPAECMGDEPPPAA